jgi:uncharacterized protein YraI
MTIITPRPISGSSSNQVRPTATPRPANSASNPVLEQRYIAGSSTTVNIRQQPNTEAAIVTRLTFGTRINVLKAQGSWYQIEHDGTKGWVLGSLTTENPPIADVVVDAAPASPIPSDVPVVMPPTQAPLPTVPPVAASDSNSGNSGNSGGSSNYQGPPPSSSNQCARNCDEARAMGLSAQQAAACGLDRDRDGVACYGD